MNINELIEKLKCKKGKNFVYTLLETWLEELNISSTKDIETKREYYYKIYGFIWGLRATNFITDKEENEITEDLIQKAFTKLD